MNLIESLALKPNEIISLVGSGGKTTLMFALARELSSAGHRVITTTTTKIYEPTMQETPRLILEQNEEILINSIRKNLARQKHLTIARERLDEGKLDGVSPVLIEKIGRLNLAPYIVVEADGAKHHALKAPRNSEPVIPENTTMVIALVGIEALGKKLTEETVFRSEIAAKLLGLPLGSEVSREVIAMLLTHPNGIARGSPSCARIVPFINKIDLESNLNRCRDLAKTILDSNHPQIKKVILGQVGSKSRPVLEVIN